jgi:hypothetical protein
MFISTISLPGLATFDVMSNYAHYQFFGLFWYLDYVVHSDGSNSFVVRFLDFNSIVMSAIIYFGFSIIYAIQVYRYYIHKTSFEGTILFGILSMIPWLVIRMGFGYYGHISYTSDLFLPLPILLIVGIILMKIRKEEDFSTLWNDNKPDDKI